MLILTRRIGESLIISNNVTMTVLGVKGNQVRIGVNAPKDVSVHREEIYERITKENGKPTSFAKDSNNPEQDEELTDDFDISEIEEKLAKEKQNILDGQAFNAVGLIEAAEMLVAKMLIKKYKDNKNDKDGNI